MYKIYTSSAVFEVSDLQIFFLYTVSIELPIKSDPNILSESKSLCSELIHNFVCKHEVYSKSLDFR